MALSLLRYHASFAIIASFFFSRYQILLCQLLQQHSLAFFILAAKGSSVMKLLD